MIVQPSSLDPADTTAPSPAPPPPAAAASWLIGFYGAVSPVGPPSIVAGSVEPSLRSIALAEDLALFFTRAGVTGLAQLAGRSLLTVRERISHDLRYLTNQTQLLDIRILIATVTAVVLRRGAF
jgi:lipopolysaccharide/colanic/teichoic acid biosynthesis glycosyltransferase